jgi:uncharacterized protein (DUF1684 family)
MTTTLDRFIEEWQQWHSERDESLRQPLGWSSLTALYWLDDTAADYGDVPGLWRVDGDAVVRELGGETTEYRPVEGAPGVDVEFDRGHIEIIQRTGRFAIRIHDRTAPALTAFPGIPTYEPDPAWVVTGQFTAFDPPRTVTTGAVVDGLEHHHRALGLIRFVHDDAEHELVAFGESEASLRILFTDATSGVTTYPAARILQVGAVDDGLVTLDFNRASNLPCAFTDAATCPIAPSENRLAFAVEAGERTPHGRGAGA